VAARRLRSDHVIGADVTVFAELGAGLQHFPFMGVERQKTAQLLQILYAIFSGS
jgi:hypothetical protein